MKLSFLPRRDRNTAAVDDKWNIGKIVISTNCIDNKPADPAV